jgi:hypothetical protein
MKSVRPNSKVAAIASALEPIQHEPKNQPNTIQQKKFLELATPLFTEADYPTTETDLIDTLNKEMKKFIATSNKRNVTADAAKWIRQIYAQVEKWQINYDAVDAKIKNIKEQVCGETTMTRAQEDLIKLLNKDKLDQIKPKGVTSELFDLRKDFHKAYKKYCLLYNAKVEEIKHRQSDIEMAEEADRSRNIPVPVGNQALVRRLSNSRILKEISNVSNNKSSDNNQVDQKDNSNKKKQSRGDEFRDKLAEKSAEKKQKQERKDGELSEFLGAAKLESNKNSELADLKRILLEQKIAFYRNLNREVSLVNAIDPDQ